MACEDVHAIWLDAESASMMTQLPAADEIGLPSVISVQRNGRHPTGRCSPPCWARGLGRPIQFSG